MSFVLLVNFESKVSLAYCVMSNNNEQEKWTFLLDPSFSLFFIRAHTDEQALVSEPASQPLIHTQMGRKKYIKEVDTSIASLVRR